MQSSRTQSGPDGHAASADAVAAATTRDRDAAALALLSVDHLTMRFGGLLAIDDLSFEAKRGDITAIIGPNGAGKTTVFNCITGFYKPTSGRISLARANGGSKADTFTRSDLNALTNSPQRFDEGEAGGIYLLERMADSEINARAKVARTFQNIRLFTGMTVLENLIVAQHNALHRASGYGVLGLFGAASFKTAEREAIAFAAHWLERTGLIDRADDPAGDLPYGDQRRLEIARALCTRPALLCLDEPAAGLNPKESLELNALLRDIRDETNTSLLLIEHDMSVVMEISDHVVVLEYGSKISDGTPHHVQNDPKVVAAYLGVDDEDFAASGAATEQGA